MRPQYMRLPMGSKHAALILIVINTEAAKRALSRDRRRSGILCLNEERNRASRIWLRDGAGGFYVHIDDIIVETGEEEVTIEATEAIARAEAQQRRAEAAEASHMLSRGAVEAARAEARAEAKAEMQLGEGNEEKMANGTRRLASILGSLKKINKKERQKRR